MVYPDQIRRKKATSLKAFINKMCIENGSTLDGRKEVFKQLTHTKKFVPILVHEKLFLIPANDLWVNYFNISKVDGNTVFFNDKSCIEIPFPTRVLNAIHRIARYPAYNKKAQDRY